MTKNWRRSTICALLGTIALPAMAADAPAEIKIGTLYAGSGPLASASVPLHLALEWWADGINKNDGVTVKVSTTDYTLLVNCRA